MAIDASDIEAVRSAGVDAEIFDAMPMDVKRFFVNCAKLGVPNQAKSLYSVGDVLVKRSSSGSIMSDSYGVHRKWVVVAIHFGIVIGRAARGVRKLGRYEALNNPMVSLPYSLEMDPSYVDAILLDDDGYDPQERIATSAKAKQAAYRYNRSISRRMESSEDAAKFVRSLAPSDRVWIARYPLGLTVNPIMEGSRLIHIKSPIDKTAPWDEVYLFSAPSGNKALAAVSMVNLLVTTTEPYPIEKVMNP